MKDLIRLFLQIHKGGLILSKWISDYGNVAINISRDGGKEGKAARISIVLVAASLKLLISCYLICGLFAGFKISFTPLLIPIVLVLDFCVQNFDIGKNIVDT